MNGDSSGSWQEDSSEVVGRALLPVLFRVEEQTGRSARPTVSLIAAQWLTQNSVEANRAQIN